VIANNRADEMDRLTVCIFLFSNQYRLVSSIYKNVYHGLHNVASGSYKILTQTSLVIGFVVGLITMYSDVRCEEHNKLLNKSIIFF
jgi:hypothetical protein